MPARGPSHDLRTDGGAPRGRLPGTDRRRRAAHCGASGLAGHGPRRAGRHQGSARRVGRRLRDLAQGLAVRDRPDGARRRSPAPGIDPPPRGGGRGAPAALHDAAGGPRGRGRAPPRTRAGIVRGDRRRRDHRTLPGMASAARRPRRSSDRPLDRRCASCARLARRNERLRRRGGPHVPPRSPP